MFLLRLFPYLQDSAFPASLKLLLLCLNSRFCKDTKWEIAYVKSRISQTCFFFGRDSSMLFIINVVVQWQGRLLHSTKHIILYLLVHMAWPQSDASFCFFALSRKFHIKVTFSLNPCLIFTNTYAFNLKTSTSRASSPAKEKCAKNPYNESVIVELERLVLRFLTFSLHHTLNILEPDWSFLYYVYTFLTLFLITH